MKSLRSDAQELGLSAGFAADDLVRAVVRWHFDPQSGSPFWLSRSREWDFDPLTEVLTCGDLLRFPDVSAELARVPIDELVPQGCRGQRLHVFESGGTLGAPKRIIETGSRQRALDWVDDVLSRHGAAADGGHWLHIGPSGPHIVGRSMGLLAARRGGTCFYIDFDPRWVRRMLADGDSRAAQRYIEHVLDQCQSILESQRVSVVFATPPVIEAACARPRLEKLLAQRMSTLLWSGTSISDETLGLLEEEIFPAAAVIGIYGNSLMGIAPQRPREQADRHRCVFQPPHPYALVDVVDPDEPSQLVACGERGRIRVSLLSKDMFLPGVLERDTAVRVAAVPGFSGDGVAGVQPFQPAATAGQIIEGVY